MCKPSTQSNWGKTYVSKGLHHRLLILSKKHNHSLLCTLVTHCLADSLGTFFFSHHHLSDLRDRSSTIRKQCSSWILSTVNKKKKILKNDNLYQKQCIFLSSPWKFMVGYINPVKPEVRWQKKIVLYNITRGHLRQGGKTENPTLADFYYLFSSGLDLLSTYTQK